MDSVVAKINVATKTQIAFKAVWEEFHQNCTKATAVAMRNFHTAPE